MRVQGIARYTHVNNPSAPKGSDKKRHSINVLVHKSDPQCAAITAEVETAKQNGFPSGFPANGHVCWQDCAVTDQGKPELADYMQLAASTKIEQGRPAFVNTEVQPIIDPAADGTTDGNIVYVDIGIASFDQVSKGVKAYLNGVMDTGQAGALPREVLTSKPDANQMFGDVAATVPIDATQHIAANGVPVTPPSVAPTPSTPPVVPTPPVLGIGLVMTEAANGATYEQYKAQNWTDEQMIAAGVAQKPSFG